MKNARKCLPALLAAIILLMGCSAEQEDISGTITPNETAGAAVPTSYVEAIPQETSESTAETEENPVSLGRIEGGVYTNTYAGFGCVLDANWVFYSAAELQELPGDVQELFSDSDLSDAFADVTQIADMKAENANDLTIINVLYNKLDAQSRLVYALMSEEDILDATMEQKDLLISTYSQAGIEVDTMEKVEVEFLGETHYAMRTSSTWDGVPYYALQLFDYHAGAYGITVTFSSYFEDRTEDLLTLFYKVE